MNIITLDDLRARIHEVGLGYHAEALLRVAAPAIRLTTHEVKEDTPLGSTKLGGLPDLPPGVAWPVVDGILLEFVGQFRLADLTSYDAEGRLPQSGMLYFFFDGMLTGYEYGETKDRRAVLYYDGPFDALTRRQMPPHDHGRAFKVFSPCALCYQTLWTLPPIEAIDTHEKTPLAPILSSRESGDHYEELSEPYDYGNFSHRLLGHPDYVQLGDTRYMLALDHDTEGRFISDGFGNYTNTAEFVAEARRWLLLAQFTGDEHARTSWGNGGMIYFWIREEDLAARRFDRVYGELVST